MRARAHSFPLSKRARLFPSAAYRRSAPPQLALDRLKWRCLSCFGAAGWFRSAKKQTRFFALRLTLFIRKQRRLECFDIIGFFCNAKGQRMKKHTLAFYAGHEARRRMAVFPIQLTRSHTKPASRGTCRATAVKPRPTPMSPYGAQSERGSASEPKVRPTAVCSTRQLTENHTRPASREACRRAAVKRSQVTFPRAAPRPMGAVWGAGRREEARIQWMQPP